MRHLIFIVCLFCCWKTQCQLPINLWDYEKFNGKVKQITFSTIDDSLSSWRRDYVLSFDNKGQIILGKMITGGTAPDTTYIELSYTFGRVDLQIDKLNTKSLNGISRLYLYHYKQMDDQVIKIDRKIVYEPVGFYNYPTYQYSYTYQKDYVEILQHAVNLKNGKLKKRNGEKTVLRMQNNLLKYSCTYYWSSFLGRKKYKTLYNYKYDGYVLDANGNWIERTVDWYIDWFGQKNRKTFKERRMITYY